MKKLILYTLPLWVLLPMSSQAMFTKIANSFSNARFFNNQNFHTSTPQSGMFNRWWKKFNGPSAETKNQFTQLENHFDKIRKENWDNPTWSETKISSQDIQTILHIIGNIRQKDINKPLNYINSTLLTTCIQETSHFPDADAEIIIKKLLEKGADIGYNPRGSSPRHETPLWQAALNGNAGAYSTMLDHSQDIHLSRPYAGNVLKLPYVIAFGLKRLKTMEEYYMAELQKIKNGERLGCSYSYFDKVGSGSFEPFHTGIPTKNLNRIAWFKNRFQKIQDRNTHYHSSFENKNALPAHPLEEEPLIYKFLEERIHAFDEYKHGKIHSESNSSNAWHRVLNDSTDPFFRNEHSSTTKNRGSSTAFKNGSIPRKPAENLDQMYQLLQREEDLSDHEILGVADNANQNEIKDAYHYLVKIVHPDRYTDIHEKNMAELAMKVLNQAFDNLTKI